MPEQWDKILGESEKWTGLKSNTTIRLPTRDAPQRRHRSTIVRSMDQVNPSLRQVFRDLASGQREWPLYLYGRAGVGKTRACLALLDYTELGWYATVDRVIEETLGRTDGQTWKLLPDYHLVVIDEVASRAKPTEIDYGTVKRLADAREDLATIWISNTKPAELAESYDDRIASRLLCGTVYELIDDDRRMGKA